MRKDFVAFSAQRDTPLNLFYFFSLFFEKGEALFSCCLSDLTDEKWPIFM